MSRPPEHPPGWKNDTYTVTYVCTNCGHKQLVKILKGQKAQKATWEPCNECGCITLEKEQ